MSHLNEGSIQAFLDGELDAATHAEVDGHLASCASCEADLRSLTEAGQIAGGALALLDSDVVVRKAEARAAIAAAAGTPASTDVHPERLSTIGRPRRFFAAGATGLARAAMLLLALAGAGAAAIPGSPVRRALDATFARVAQLFAPEPITPVVVDAPAAPVMVARSVEWAAIPDADGRVRVQLHASEGIVEVTVRLVDAARANVETRMDEGDVSFVSGTGRLEVLGLGTGEVVIEIPRDLPSATIQVGGQVHVYKEDGMLRLSGPAGDGQGSEVRFRIGT